MTAPKHSTASNLPLSAIFFAERLTARQKADGTKPVGIDRKELQNFVSTLSLLKECEVGLIIEIMNIVVLTKYFEGDRISGSEIKENMLFVYEGRIARNIDLGDGWYNVLDIVKEKQWLNDTVFIATDGKNDESFEVLSEYAVVLSIPIKVVLALLNKHLPFAMGIIHSLSRVTDRYRKLWMRA